MRADIPAAERTVVVIADEVAKVVTRNRRALDRLSRRDLRADLMTGRVEMKAARAHAAALSAGAWSTKNQAKSRPTASLIRIKFASFGR